MPPEVQSPNNGSSLQEFSVPSIQIIADESTSHKGESSLTERPEDEHDHDNLSIKDADQSIAIINETKSIPSVEPFKPLSSFNSFGQRIQYGFKIHNWG